MKYLCINLFLLQVSILDSILSDFIKIEIPQAVELAYSSDDFGSIKITDGENLFLIKKRNHNKSVINSYLSGIKEEFKLNYYLDEEYFDGSYLIKPNSQNIYYLFVSYPFLATGSASNIQRIFLLFNSDNKTQYTYELSSFFGSLELLRDFNGNGKLEYACIKLIRYQNADFYVVNFFGGFELGTLKNLSRTDELFAPRVFELADGAIRPIKEIPLFLNEDVYFSEPIVF